MNDKDKIKINLQMANSFYPLWIKPEEEEIVRKAAKRVNRLLNMYREKNPGFPTEQILCMIAYQLSRENLELKERNDTAPYSEKIKELTELLDGFLREEE